MRLSRIYLRMKKMSRLQLWLLKILSWSPVLRITDDSGFNQISRNSTQFRVSIVSFNVGVSSFYFLTWDASRRFKLMHKLSLYEVQGFYQNINSYGNEYDAYLAELGNKSSHHI